MNFSRDYGPLQVSHRPTHGDYFDSILHFHVRELPPIYETIETKIAELVKQHLTDPARQLPEVILYRELRDKDTGIADVLAKIDADRELLQIDHRRAILTLSGEELATTLASIKEKLQAVESRVQAVRDGQDAFRREVAKARDLAVAALDRLLVAALPTLNDLLEAEVKRTHS
ncbi:MAG TPA: hypothetical protein VFE62_20590, partial [Gemmataceae bacterium]|nr:hypothetical protein [Gemmataceae bacterium]